MVGKAGRVVIPKSIRGRLGFVAGTELEVTDDSGGVRLERAGTGPKLVRLGRRLIAQPAVPVNGLRMIDIAAIIEQERNR